MGTALAWGLEIVRGAQAAASPFLTSVMKGLSFAGTEYCLLVLLPFVYWCVDKRRGIRIGILVFLSTALNFGLKSAFAQPRPYDLDPSVGMAAEKTYGLPSNHAQVSVVLWGSLAPLFRVPWGLVLAIVLPFLVGISRIYLGVHFPTDVLAGWALGAAIVFVDRKFGERIERAIPKLKESLALALIAAIALFMNVLTKNDTSISGAFFGLAGASVYAKRQVPFSVSGGLGKRGLRFLFGMATIAIVYLLPKLFLASIEAGGPPIIRFLRYALLGAWVAMGAPWLFMKLGLASAEGPGDHSASEKEGSLISK
jgi:membrane-associated phospholipid phosphatase